MKGDREVPLPRRHRMDREVPIARELADVGPVPRAWVIFQALGPTVKREEALAACKKAGINANTAATQYQLWQYGRRQAHVARTLPKGVRRKIERAAEADMR